MKIYHFKILYFDDITEIIKTIVQLYSSLMRISQSAGVATKRLEQFACKKLYSGSLRGYGTGHKRGLKGFYIEKT
jgi:hypothetical protein